MTVSTPDQTQIEGGTNTLTPQAYGVAWRKQRLAAGCCLMCASPSRQKPDGTYKYLCQGCADKAVLRQRLQYSTLKRQRHEWPAPLVPPRGGDTTCLRCEAVFASPDVTKVRICPSCRPLQEAIIERGVDADGGAVDIQE